MDKNLGALEIETNNYVLPNKSLKHGNYKCVDCNQRVILRKGEIRRAHFSHFSPTDKCKYYEHPNESQLHKDAKYKLQDKLKNKFPIQLDNFCPKCSTNPAGLYEHVIEYLDNDNVVIEYRDPSGKFIADVAIINDSKIRYIFEVKNTHTTTSVRPEPWFEIDANEIIEEELRINNPKHPEYELLGQKYYLNCIRTHKERFCGNCRIETEEWAKYLPFLEKKHGGEKWWKQDKPCMKCGRQQYSPVFIQGFRQICKMCICEHENSLKLECDEKRKNYLKSIFD